MVLISFLYIVTTKVIQHNLEKKVPTYVYYLYKNLENESKLLTKKLLDQTNQENSSSGSNEVSNDTSGTSNKTIEDILKGIDAKNYCKVFSDDLNIIGNVDCENSSKEYNISITTNNINNYICTRSYLFNVQNNGTYSEKYTPTYDSNYQNCENINDFNLHTLRCNAQPKILINNLIIPNTNKLHTYNCIKEEKTIDSSVVSNDFDISEKLNLSNNIKTTNNIYLNFITLVLTNVNAQYNLKAKISQDEICPEVNLEGNEEDFIFLTKPIFDYVIEIANCVSYRSDLSGGQFLCIWGANHYLFARLNNKRINNASSGIDEENKQCYTKIDTCYGRIENLQVQKNLLDFFGNGQTLKFHHNKNNIVYKEITQKWPFKDYFYGESEAYYDKWSTFFKNIGKTGEERQTIEAIKEEEFNEGIISSNSQINENVNNKINLAHFIYASIDTPFSEGEMNKNIFVFEQFGNKIIPVGYLANNPNTPLKFDVITRDPQTLKIEKINDKPLNFCEAMKYTGDKFSQYCGCKDEDNNIVTEFSKIEVCNNHFGCTIRPIKPSLSSWF